MILLVFLHNIIIIIHCHIGWCMPGIQCHNIIVNNINSPCTLLLPRISLGNNFKLLIICTPENEDALKSNEDNYMYLVDKYYRI